MKSNGTHDFLLNKQTLDIPKEAYLHLWKRKKSSEGYHRSYFARFSDGTDCTIEYNFLREVVKIEIHFFDDPRDFCVMIQRGSIIKEREVQSNRPVSLYNRMQKYKKFFNYLIDDQILKTIGGNYGISEKSLHPNATNDFNLLQLNKNVFIKPKKILERMKEYLHQKEIRQKGLKGIQKFYNRILGDIFDILVLILFFYYFVIGKFSSFGFVFLSFFYGLLSGFLDVFFRRRKPLMLKTSLFFLLGILIFWFQYQLYEWNIYEPANEKLWLLNEILKEKMKNLNDLKIFISYNIFS
ncbi:MAG: hypothetical protein ACK4UJ_11355 [Leptonema sp. (in: bacteria)]